MNKLLLAIILSLLFICSCTDDGIGEGKPVLNPMNLENLEVGDRFLYSFLIGDSYHDEDNFDFYYTADTLELEIVDASDGKFLIKESILPTSSIFQTSENYLRKDSVFHNYWTIENDNLTISIENNEQINSHLILFNYSAIDFVFSLEEFSSQEVELKGWKTENSYVGGVENFFTRDFELFGQLYDRLNVRVQNFAMVVDGDGRTFVYSKENGFIRIISYSAWTGRGRGWDKI